MPRCSCCGQQTGDAARPSDRAPAHAAGRPTVWVDEAVLAVCNAAHDFAARQSAARVELAHLIYALALQPAADPIIADFGLSARALLIAAEPVMFQAEHTTNGRAPTTASEIKTIIARAQDASAAAGRDVVTLNHLISAILFDSDDLSSAAFVRRLIAPSASSRAPAPATAPHRAAFSSWLATATSRQDVPPQTALAAPQSPTTGRAAAETDITGIAARLATQEQLLQRLLSQVTIIASANADPNAHKRLFRRRAMHPALAAWAASSKSSRGSRRASAKAARAAANPPPQPEAEPDDPPLEPDYGIDAGADADDTGTTDRPKRFYLALDDDILRAPSVGPRTAARLVTAGIAMVRDLLRADPQELSLRLDQRHMTPARVTAWQAQARLVCTMPWLRGTHAQLLVGAGFDTIDKILEADDGALCAAVLQFAMTRDGQSVLRSGPPPDMERIVRWIEYAALAERHRAA